MSDLFVDSAQHGGQLGEGYGRAKTQGADFSHGIALYLEKVSVWFDSFRALNDLSLYIAEGELRCIIGPNGAGKTTLMDVITGKTRPTTGTAFFGQNYDLAKMSTEEIAEAGIGRKFQKPTVFENFTVMENLLLAAPRDKRVKKSLFSRLDPEAQLALEESLEQIRLKEFVKKPAGLLSHGQKQWLEIGMLLMQRPQLLLVDADSPEALQRKLAALAGPTRLDLPAQHETDEARQRAAIDRSVVRSSVEAFMEQLRSDDKLLHILLREGSVGSDAFKQAVDRQLNYFEEELRLDLIRRRVERAGQRIDLIETEAESLGVVHDGKNGENADAVGNEVRRIEGTDDTLAEARGQPGFQRIQGAAIGRLGADDLDQMHVARRVEEVDAAEARPDRLRQPLGQRIHRQA